MATRRPLTVNDLLGLKIAGEVSVGPGPRIAYTLREADMEESTYRSQVWSVAPGQEPVQLTRGQKNGAGPRWAPDGRYLAFTTSRPSGKAGEDGPKTQVWLLPAAGGEAFCLTTSQLGVRSFEWAPDGQTIFFVADEPDLDATRARKAKEKKQKLDAVVEHAEKRRRQVWQVEAREGAEAKLVFDGCFGLTSIAPSPDGKELAYTTNYSGLWEDSKRFDLWVLSLESGSTRQLTSGTGGLYGPTWSPAGDRIAFLAPHDPRYTYSRIELFAVPAAGGTVVNLTGRNEAFLGDVVDVAWESEAHLLMNAAVGCYSHIYRFEAATGSVTRLTAREEISSGMALSADRRYLAYVTESAYSVPEVMLLDLQGEGGPQTLTDVNPKLKSDIAFGEQKVIAWEGEGGMTIEGVLTLPAGYKEGERLPLLVYVHGGPHGRTPNALRQYMNFQVLAANGYAVLAPNYRGGTGYGHEHAVSNRCDLGGADYRDIMAGVDHLIAKGVADGDRMGILGGSYGGYMTNWAIGQTKRFKAAVSMFGIFSLISDYSQSDLPSWEVGYLDGYWWENPEAYARCSPSTHVLNMTTPVLIIHGDADNNTYPSNSKEMYQALRHLGRTVQYVHYPREGHGIQEPNHKQDEYRRVLAWFSRHILGETALVEGSVEYEGHGLSVEAAQPVESYSGRKPKGRYVEIAVRLVPAPEESLKLDLSDVRLVTEEGALTWEVGVAGVAAGPLLIPAGGAVEAGAPAGLTLVFDVPAKAPTGDWRLVAAQFPPLKVSL